MEVDNDANKYGNNAGIEMAWAMKAYEHAEIYFNLISSLDCSELQFTKRDDEIYNRFKTEIKDMKIDILDADLLKSEASKSLWRPFCESFKDLIEDYNFATLLRLDAAKELSDENTILVPRIQFWAIEIARNRDGINKNLLRKKN